MPSGYTCIGDMPAEVGLVFEYCLQTHVAFVKEKVEVEEKKAEKESVQEAIAEARQAMWRKLGGI